MLKKAALGLYVGALVWWLCHPWASLSTGELKARQLYVDEHAFVVQALVQDGIDSRVNSAAYISLPPLPPVDGFEEQRSSEDALCETMMAMGVTSCTGLNHNNNSSTRKPSSLTEVVIDSTGKPLGAEAIIFVLTNYGGEANTRHSTGVCTDFVHQLMQSSAWLSKRVIVLLLHVDCEGAGAGEASGGDICRHGGKYKVGQHSAVLDTWLKSSTGSSRAALVPGAGVATGLIREAYVFDLNSSSSSSDDRPVAAPAKHSSPFTLRFSGVNGALPNMDMISASMALFPGGLETEAGAGASSNNSPDPVVALYSLLDRAVLHIASSAGSLAFDGQDYLSGYLEILSGLARHSAVLAGGGGDGLHSQFLAHNIDSITIGRNSSSGNDNDNVVHVMLQLARLSSGLHEELHHSHFLYVLMGRQSFVGLSEYCGPMGLALLSFFLLFVEVVETGLFQSIRAFAAGIASVCTDSAPVLAIFAAMLMVDTTTANGGVVLANMYTWGYVLCGHCLWIWLRGLYFRPTTTTDTAAAAAAAAAEKDEQECSRAAHSAVAVVAMQMVCVVIAGVHFTLSFPLTIALIPLAWLVFGEFASSKSNEGGGGGRRPRNSDNTFFITLAVVCGPTSLMLLSYCTNNSMLMLEWILSWQLQQAWNLPVLYWLSTLLCSGCLRHVRR
jgi:hypothetical protein